jgi:hypothetical protein
MTACKSHQRQIALLAAHALDESERSAVLEHLNQCPACQEYWNQVQGVVGLYTQDAERSVTVGTNRLPTRRFEPAWPKVAMLAAAAIVVLCGTLLLLRESPDVNSPLPVPIAKIDRPLSIADARHLAGKDLDDLMRMDMAVRHQRPDFVFSAGMRHEGP